ncbi:trk system potassium uptake protein TrkA [Micrococcus cohnii]|uniref:Trk system potassium uptake protein TrkA n=1 Tax=Micrococcus cohnii TaxID=993416 RepID=A0A7W7M382_9MICC|nr:trk system potassium uptake protein TrkA [Micrococcus cohnii]
MAHFVILGCGRVGVELIRMLESFGHSVAVVDRDPHAFTALPATFDGRCVQGVGFDRDTLVRAGIEKAVGLAAVSSDDGTNVIAARVAREHFGTRHVVARIHDPERARVYQRLGVSTVAAVRWTSEQVFTKLLPAGTAQSGRRDATGSLVMTEIEPDPQWWGRSVGEIEDAATVRVGYLTRFEAGLLPTQATLLQEGDVLHIVVEVSRQDDAEAIIMSAPERQENA